MRRSRCVRAEPQRFNPFEVLPPVIVRAVLLRLTITQRARCACVCRRWRELVADPELWLRLDFAGYTYELPRISRNSAESAVCSASARAQGRLEALDVTALWLTLAVLSDVVAANAASLRELRLRRVDSRDGAQELEQLLRTAPALQVAVIDSLKCGYGAARRLLRSEPPWDRLVVPRLELSWKLDHEPGAHEDAVVSEPMPVSQVRHLEVLGGYHRVDDALQWVSFDLPEMDEVVDLALANRLTALTLTECNPTASTVPALARLLSRSDTLQELSTSGMHTGPVLIDAEGVDLLADALRANVTLRDLTLNNVALFYDADAAVTLLRSLTGHASLRSVDVAYNDVRETDAELIGAALGELVAADAPALWDLNLSCLHLESAGLGQLAAALPHNTHLRVLTLEVNGMCVGFVKTRLVPAVLANTSLRKLGITEYVGEDNEELAQLFALAEGFVEAREAAREAAEALIDAAAVE